MYNNLVGPSRHFVPAGTGVLGSETLSAAGAVHGEYVCMKRCIVKRIGFVVTTEVAADDTAPQVEFNKRPTIGSATGESVVGELTIPDETAVGQIVYKDVDVELLPGQSLALEHITQAADAGAAAGAGYYVFELEDKPDYIPNDTNFVESA